jgi:hypothetical protein
MPRSSFAYLWLLTFIVVLALVIGWRLPAESRPMVAGVLAGVAASVPTSFVVAWLATRALHPAYRRRRAWQADAPAGPAIIVEHAPLAPDDQP